MKMTQLQLGKLKENCSLLKLYCKLRKMFLSPDGNRTRNLLISDPVRCSDALTIELPGLRCHAECVYVWHHTAPEAVSFSLCRCVTVC